jgi:hypothetical protein
MLYYIVLFHLACFNLSFTSQYHQTHSIPYLTVEISWGAVFWSKINLSAISAAGWLQIFCFATIFEVFSTGTVIKINHWFSIWESDFKMVTSGNDARNWLYEGGDLSLLWATHNNNNNNKSNLYFSNFCFYSAML